MKWTLIVLSILTGCSAGKEVILPFKNLNNYGDRLLPVQTNDSDFTFRVWIGNSTSIDRVITISSDTLEGFKGTLIEFGKLYKKKNSKDYLRQLKIEPKSGFKEFKEKLTRMSMLTTKSQEKEIELALHQPFSIYVVEFKNKGQFNTFKFRTYFPNDQKHDEKYDKIEKFIFEEFDLVQYFKLKN